ncbi:common plant regulatory factor 1-like isoform X2 [Euphorbia lathyris]|uniref:common plant regulatory factor 1-like isoform X2 n=1 Tax=Euphorbia lathyris TaxID=212925 RepID=UPI0033138C61
MGNSEEGKSSKPDKSSSPAPPDQTSVHVYPDWAAMQAYYGPRVPMPPQYYNSAMAAGHAPHPYMWGPPQHMMAPYGAPYAAVYSHGGVYAHPAVPIAVTLASAETPAKSSTSTDRGLMKKLKGFDGLAMSIGNGNSNPESADGGDCRLSQSAETEVCSDGSDGSSVGKKRSPQGTPSAVGEGKIETASSVATGDTAPSSDKVLGTGFAYSGASGKGHVVSPSTNTVLELRNPPANVAKTSGASAAQPSQVLPPETWIQNEREVKRERRKQSNRESARRSRLRKQAETEELAHRVESLTTENLALKSEVDQLNEKSEKLRLENAALLEKLKNKQMGHTQVTILKGGDEKRMAAVSTENLLSRVNNSVSVDRNTGEEGEAYERNPGLGAKLHQLLGTSPSPRADAVAAG